MTTQGVLALILVARHHPTPWRDATYWFTLCGTVGDIVCLAGMRYFTHREGILLRDLLGPIRMRHGRDMLLGLAYLALSFIFFTAGGYTAQRLFYGSNVVNPTTYLIHSHALPLWAVIYSLSVWWVIQSSTEEATYQAYVLPRLEALTGRTWVGVAAVAFCWTAQHCAMGFVPDWRFLACRFLAFLPGILVMIGIYVRTRRLMPLIIAHWLMDIWVVLMTAVF